MPSEKTFAEMCEVCPALETFERGAREAARNRWAGYPRWIDGCKELRRDVNQCTALDGYKHGKIIIKHLKKVFAETPRGQL